MFIKQFGLQRSGTNIVKALIEINFSDTQVLSMYLGDKHKPNSWTDMEEYLKEPPALDFDIEPLDLKLINQLIHSREIKVVINIKEPIPWLESYTRYQKKKILFRNPDANFSFDINWAERCLGIWKDSVLSWLSIANEVPDNCIVIEHYETLKEPEKLLARISEKFQLGTSQQIISKFENEVKRSTYNQHGQDLINPLKKFDPSYHLNGEWLEEYPPEILDFAIQHCAELANQHPIFLDYGLQMHNFPIELFRKKAKSE